VPDFVQKKENLPDEVSSQVREIAIAKKAIIK